MSLNPRLTAALSFDEQVRVEREALTHEETKLAWMLFYAGRRRAGGEDRPFPSPLYVHQALMLSRQPGGLEVIAQLARIKVQNHG